MTISFPRSFPTDYRLVGLSFYPEPMSELTPLRSGRIISVGIGPTLWRGKWQFLAPNADEAAEVRAWYASLLSYEAFYGYDKIREYPRNYASGWGSLTVGGNPFSGTAALTGVASGNVVCTLENLPANFVLKSGDYFSFPYGTDSQALHMVVASATANSSGILSVEVRPSIRAGWAAVAPAVCTVSLYRAAAKMIIIPGTWSDMNEPPAVGCFSFEAVQIL